MAAVTRMAIEKFVVVTASCLLPPVLDVASTKKASRGEAENFRPGSNPGHIEVNPMAKAESVPSTPLRALTMFDHLPGGCIPSRKTTGSSRVDLD